MKRKQLDLTQQLSSVPVRNTGVEVSKSEDGKALVIRVRLTYPLWLRGLKPVLKLRDHRRFELDSLGSRIYESIDGKRTFEELIDAFAEEHKLTFFEARALLAQYIRMLMRKGLVVIAVKD